MVSLGLGGYVRQMDTAMNQYFSAHTAGSSESYDSGDSGDSNERTDETDILITYCKCV